MAQDGKNTTLGQDFEAARDGWQGAYEKQLPDEEKRHNRSGIEVMLLYTPED